MRKVLCGCFASAALLSLPVVLSAEDAKDGASQDVALFDRLDTDKDGQLTAAEIPEDKRRLFQRLLRNADQDKSGGLSHAEFLAGVADRGPDRPLEEKPTLDSSNPSGLPNPEQFFKNFDKNLDGKVTLDEMPDEGRDRFQQLLTRADKNNDNAISKEEMTDLINTTNKQLKAGTSKAAIRGRCSSISIPTGMEKYRARRGPRGTAGRIRKNAESVRQRRRRQVERRGIRGGDAGSPGAARR